MEEIERATHTIFGHLILVHQLCSAMLVCMHRSCENTQRDCCKMSEVLLLETDRATERPVSVPACSLHKLLTDGVEI